MLWLYASLFVQPSTIQGCLVVSPPMFRMRPANGKPVQWRGGWLNELVLPQPSEPGGEAAPSPALHHASLCKSFAPASVHLAIAARRKRDSISAMRFTGRCRFRLQIYEKKYFYKIFDVFFSYINHFLSKQYLLRHIWEHKIYNRTHSNKAKSTSFYNCE